MELTISTLLILVACCVLYLSFITYISYKCRSNDLKSGQKQYFEV